MRRRILIALILTGAAGPLAAGVNRWTRGTPFWGPRYTSRIVPHPRIPGLLYAGTGDGIMRSDDRGETWRVVLPWQRTTYMTIAIDPRSDRVLYSDAAEGGVLQSRDGGASWIRVSDTSTPVVMALVIAPSDPTTLFALDNATQTGVYRSRDSGASWTRVLIGSSTISEIEIAPTNSSLVYAAAGDAGVFASTDGGDHWSPANNGLPSSSATSISFDAAASEIYLINANVVYRSGDGSTWTEALTGNRDFQRVVSHAGVPGTAYAWSFYTPYRTTDGGVHWAPMTELPQSNYLREIAGEPGDPRVVYAAANMLFRSEDSGASWAQVGRFQPRISGMVLCTSDEPDTVYAFGGSRRFSYSMDRGETWTFATNDGLDTLVEENFAVSASAPHVFYAGTANGVFRSEDRGEHWIALGPYDKPTGVVLDPRDPDRVFANTTLECGRFFCIYEGDRSTDGGRTWSLLQTDSGQDALAFFVSGAMPQSVFGNMAFPYQAGLWRGELDGPLSFDGNAPTTFFMVADPQDPMVLYDVGVREPQSGLFRSDDGGATWIFVSDGVQPGSQLAIDPADPRRFVATAIPDLLSSVDGGVTWTVFEGPPEGARVGSLAFSADGRTLYAGTNLGVYQYTFCDECRPLTDSARRPPATVPDRPNAP